VRRSYARPGAFVLDAKALTDLERILASTGQPRSYNVRLRDGTSDTYDALEPVLQLPNSKPRAIRSLSAVAADQSWTRRVTVELDGRLAEIGFELNADSADVASLNEKLDEWAMGVRPWYSRIAQIKWGTVALAVLVVLAIFETLLFITPSSNKLNPTREAVD
jgi:hypothetical protein